MPERLATCATCERAGEEKPFVVPWGDHIGPALMQAHYEEHHPEVQLNA